MIVLNSHKKAFKVPIDVSLHRKWAFVSKKWVHLGSLENEKMSENNLSVIPSLNLKLTK